MCSSSVSVCSRWLLCLVCVSEFVIKVYFQLFFCFKNVPMKSWMFSEFSIRPGFKYIYIFFFFMQTLRELPSRKHYGNVAFEYSLNILKQVVTFKKIMLVEGITKMFQENIPWTMYKQCFCANIWEHYWTPHNYILLTLLLEECLLITLREPCQNVSS